MFIPSPLLQSRSIHRRFAFLFLSACFTLFTRSRVENQFWKPSKMVCHCVPTLLCLKQFRSCFKLKSKVVLSSSMKSGRGSQPFLQDSKMEICFQRLPDGTGTRDCSLSFKVHSTTTLICSLPFSLQSTQLSFFVEDSILR
jgi:hypothetical protein